jgi:hypothetical protein
VQEQQMAAMRFQPGDRVRARVSTPRVQAGALGTVTAVYPTMPNAFEVRFDGQPTPLLMRADELELADQPADDTAQP